MGGPRLYRFLVVGGLLALPSLSLARPTVMPGGRGAPQTGGSSSEAFFRRLSMPSHGAGDVAPPPGQGPFSPSNARIDTSSRGPLNDVQPGNVNDPPDAAHPQPVR
jgi:hypothetical protein